MKVREPDPVDKVEQGHIEQSRIVWETVDTQGRRSRHERRLTAIVFSELATGYYAHLKELGCARCPRCGDYVMLDGHVCPSWSIRPPKADAPC